MRKLLLAGVAVLAIASGAKAEEPWYPTVDPRSPTSIEEHPAAAPKHSANDLAACDSKEMVAWIKTSKLQNLFGAENEILALKNIRQFSRQSDRLICLATGVTSTGIIPLTWDIQWIEAAGGELPGGTPASLKE